MGKFKKLELLLAVGLIFNGFGCRDKSSQMANAQEAVKEGPVTLYDKTLPEIKKHVNGKWELISGQNKEQFCEYENTFIVFDDDKYIWIEDGKEEPGDLNWRQEDTKEGYKSYLMDVFYSTNPAYPLSVNGDTLYIQDCSQTRYKYKLIRK